MHATNAAVLQKATNTGNTRIRSSGKVADTAKLQQLELLKG